MTLVFNVKRLSRSENSELEVSPFLNENLPRRINIDYIEHNN